MIKGKKAIVNFIVVIFVLIALGAILLKDSADKDTTIKIGERQVLILKTYLEAEKIREFASEAARLAAMEAAAQSGAKTGQDCFAGLQNFQSKFQEQFEKHFTLSEVSNDLIKLTQPPAYLLSSSITPTEIRVTGTSSGQIVLEGEDFTYGAGAYFSQAVNCKDFETYSKATAGLIS